MISYSLKFLVHKMNKLCLLGAFLTLSLAGFSQADTTPVSTRHQALLYIEGLKELKASPWWPHVKPNAFLQNIKENIITPLSLYEGNNTNFCGYAALSWFALNEDPLTYAKFMVQLYEEGNAKYGKAIIEPSASVRQAAGTLKFKGILDIHPAEQLWFLSLADHFKGYLNFFNKKYDPGDENTFWASVNYAKFNRMVKTLFNYKVHARGSDLMHPWVKDLYEYVSEQMKTGTTVLYLNNAYLHRKQHNSFKPGTPTHFTVLLNLERKDDVISITYWDYGFRSLRQITPKFFRKIVFGVSHFTKKTSDGK
jgi:hypothetical protein